MSIRLNNIAPDFDAHTTQGKINFYNWMGQHWAILFSHPKDFTPISTTELYWMTKLYSEFEKRNTKIIALSIDSLEAHKEWIADIESISYTKIKYPLIADTNLAIAKLYGMLPETTIGDWQGRSASKNNAVRYMFIISPDKVVQLIAAYPMYTGINFYEILRALDSIQLTFYNKVGTPANWEQGEDVIILPSINDEKAKELYPSGWKTIKHYLRKVPQPVVQKAQ